MSIGVFQGISARQAQDMTIWDKTGQVKTDRNTSYRCTWVLHELSVDFSSMVHNWARAGHKLDMTSSFPILQGTKLGKSSFSASLSHCSPLSFFLSNSSSCIYVKILDTQFQLHLLHFCLLAYPHAPLSASWTIKTAATHPPPHNTNQTNKKQKQTKNTLKPQVYINIYIYVSAIIIFWLFETKMSITTCQHIMQNVRKQPVQWQSK